ncbi:NAD-dependent epimerase/dehydratase family protein [Kitasatospora aureofaciens]|uniref:NAD-dependent dehydratase n=1 Tax=Kitasatospora aureofaciens TaxID=1894 RepID=A0A8H9LLB9_KITAU|nr:NAD-dependent dehydratase [Kitasatospora aureofaciens]QEV00003.1 NAD-dependent epimerase/dehydratase family protein [Streptomyces viridifaciens]GGU77261.1 NAD-dependent dehydratase [Kitasatospora aureofaciens]
MSSPPSDVRSGLTAGEDDPDTTVSPPPAYGGRPLTVAVTGAAGVLGERVAARLVASPHVRRVLAVDDRRGEVAGVQWRVLDVRDPAVAERLAGVDVVVHLAMDFGMESDPRARSAYNVRGAQTVLTAAAAAGVHRVVLCTSAMVYGALADNEVPLAEDSELRATEEASLVGDLLEIERLARRAPRAHPGLQVTVLRPAVVVGPGVDTVLTRHFEAPRLLVVAGSRPCWQFCHVEDLAAALEYAALGLVEGEVTVGCDGWLEQEDVERLSGIRRMELPAALALGTAARLHRLGLTPAPAGDLAYTMYPWVVSGSRLHEAGWRPEFTNEQVLAELLAQVSGKHAVAGRRLGGKEAATSLGAAGATVALVGTAALVRRARKRRRF